MRALTIFVGTMVLITTLTSKHAGRNAKRAPSSKVVLRVPGCFTRSHRGKTPVRQHRFLRGALQELYQLQITRPKNYKDKARLREHRRRSNLLVKRIFRYRGTKWSPKRRGGPIVIEPHATDGSFLNLVAQGIRQSTESFAKQPLDLVFDSQVGVTTGGFYLNDTLHVGWLPIVSDGIDASLVHGWIDSFARSGGFVLTRGLIRGSEPGYALNIGSREEIGTVIQASHDYLRLYRKEFSVDEPIAYAASLAFAGRRLRTMIAASWLSFSRLD